MTEKFKGPEIGLFDKEGCCPKGPFTFTQDPEWPVKAGQHYKHYKEGNMYTVVCVGLDCETKEPMVIYQGWLSGKVWVRSLSNFQAHVGDENSQVPRFALQRRHDPVEIKSMDQFLELFGVPKDDRIQTEDTFNRRE